MIRFFTNQTNDEKDATDSRLRSLEWKVNLILGIVAVHFLLTTLMFFSDLILPSKTTIIIVGVILIAAGWFLRKQILYLIRRYVARQIVGDEKGETKSSSRGGAEEVIQ